MSACAKGEVLGIFGGQVLNKMCQGLGSFWSIRILHLQIMINIQCSYSHHVVDDDMLLSGNKLGSRQHAGSNSPKWPLPAQFGPHLQASLVMWLWGSCYDLSTSRLQCYINALLTWKTLPTTSSCALKFLFLWTEVTLFQTVKETRLAMNCLIALMLFCLPQVLSGIGPYSCWRLLKMQNFNRIRPDERGSIWFNLQVEVSCHYCGLDKYVCM